VPAARSHRTRRTLGDESVIVRTAGGEIAAYHTACLHRGTRLAAGCGRFEHGRIQCPYHNWTYGLEGRLLAAPHMPPGFSKDDYPLHRAACALWDGHIFVFLRPDPTARPDPPALPALRDQLADLPRRFAAWQMGDLRLGRRIVYDVKANWKLIVLNYNECLHCPNLHPALNKLHHYLGADNVEPTSCYCGGAMGFRDGVGTMSMDGKRRRAYLPGLTEAQRQQVATSRSSKSPQPPHPDWRQRPTRHGRAAHDRTETSASSTSTHLEPGRPDAQIDDAVEFRDVTNKEDWWIAGAIAGRD
jgi:Rieske 2Fe-2S family protein